MIRLQGFLVGFLAALVTSALAYALGFGSSRSAWEMLLSAIGLGLIFALVAGRWAGKTDDDGKGAP